MTDLRPLLPLAALLLAVAPPAQAQDPPHRVIIEPGDVSPLAPPALGPKPFTPESPRPARDPVVRQQLDRLESRARETPEDRLPALRLEQDLRESEQRLRGLRAQEPFDPDLPRLERQREWLDRLQRRAAERRRRERQIEE